MTGWTNGGTLDPPPSSVHWEIEFPEVFEGENLASMPSLGILRSCGGTANQHSVRTSVLRLGRNSVTWRPVESPTYVAYFFRRAYLLTRRGGCFGLVATNTISQGDTRKDRAWKRSATDGGWIYAAMSRVEVAGRRRGCRQCRACRQGFGEPALHSRWPSPSISFRAFLFHRGGHNPSHVCLARTTASVLCGSYVLGIGFIFRRWKPR